MNSTTEIFRSAMNAAGIEYTGEIFFDSKLRRFKAEGDDARNSWYVVHPGPPAAGAFGCWKRGLNESWCDRSSNLSQADWQRIRQRWHEAEEVGHDRSSRSGPYRIGGESRCRPARASASGAGSHSGYVSRPSGK